MKVAVTGGTGFIGSNLVDRLVADGHEVVVIDSRTDDRDDVTFALVDIRDLDGMVEATKGCQAIFHLAGYADVNDAYARPVEATQVNVVGTTNVMEAARQNGVGRVLFASTVWVYGAAAEGAVGTEDSPLFPANAGHLYTSTKIASEMVVHSYHELYGQEFTILRYGIPYGPRMRPALVVPRFVRMAREGDPITVFGDGSISRNYVYIDDLVDAHIAALGPAGRNETFNLEGTESVSVKHIIDCIESALGTPVAVQYLPERPGEFAGRVISAEKAARVLDWRPKVSFEEGLRRYLAWADAQAPVPAAEPAPAPTAATERERVLVGAGASGGAVVLARVWPVVLAIVLAGLGGWLLPQARDHLIVALVVVSVIGAVALAGARQTSSGLKPGRRLSRYIAIATSAVVAGGIIWTGANSPTATWFGPLVSHGSRTGPAQVALTFDDGPNISATLDIANILDAQGVRGAFFTVGKALDARPDISRTLLSEGHLLANHSYHHDYVRWLAPTYPELVRTEKAFNRQLGVCPAFFRPPHGQHTPAMALVVDRKHMKMVTWDVSVGDFKSTDPAVIARNVLSRVRPGSIIDLHDGLDGKVGVDRTIVVKALPMILDGLKEKGISVVRLDDLLHRPGYLPSTSCA